MKKIIYIILSIICGNVCAQQAQFEASSPARRNWYIYAALASNDSVTQAQFEASSPARQQYYIYVAAKSIGSPSSAPTGPAGGELSGTYPNPALLNGVVLRSFDGTNSVNPSDHILYDPTGWPTVDWENRALIGPGVGSVFTWNDAEIFISDNISMQSNTFFLGGSGFASFATGMVMFGPDGNIVINKTIATDSGDQAQSTASGSVELKHGITNLVVTNPLAHTTSLIQATIRTLDLAMYSVAIETTTDGEFTIYAVPAAPLINVRIDYLITN